MSDQTPEERITKAEQNLIDYLESHAESQGPFVILVRRIIAKADWGAGRNKPSLSVRVDRSELRRWVDQIRAAEAALLERLVKVARDNTLKFHACVTGDCPHHTSSDCYIELTRACRNMPDEIEAAMREEAGK